MPGNQTSPQESPNAPGMKSFQYYEEDFSNLYLYILHYMKLKFIALEESPAQTIAEDDPPPPYGFVLPLPSSKTISVFSICLCSCDRIRLIGCPLELQLKFRSVIEKSWGVIQKEKTYYHQSHEFKLEGFPWSSYDSGVDCVKSRTLLIEMLSCAVQNGFTLLQGTDISRIDGDCDVLFFESAPPDANVDFVAMSLHANDLIRLHNAPTALRDLLKDAILSKWSKGIQQERVYCGSFEIKVQGTPWLETEFGSRSVSRTLLMCHIISNFRAAGYRLYAALDVTQALGGKDLDTWIFRKEPY